MPREDTHAPNCLLSRLALLPYPPSPPSFPTLHPTLLARPPGPPSCPTCAEVLAHDMMVDPKSCEWKVSLNADGWKTEALSRALHTSKAPPQAIVHIGRCACDLPVATGGKVSCLIAPVGSELSRLAHASKVKHREFGGWDALAALIMGTGSVNAVAIADGTDLADLTEIDP